MTIIIVNRLFVGTVKSNARHLAEKERGRMAGLFHPMSNKKLKKLSKLK